MKTTANLKSDDLVPITLPRATGREENFVFVGLNGKGYTVMRGVTAKVPRPVYDILTEARLRQERQAEFIRQQQDNAARSAAASGV